MENNINTVNTDIDEPLILHTYLDKGMHNVYSLF